MKAGLTDLLIGLHWAAHVKLTPRIRLASLSMNISNFFLNMSVTEALTASLSSLLTLTNHSTSNQSLACVHLESELNIYFEPFITCPTPLLHYKNLISIRTIRRNKWIFLAAKNKLVASGYSASYFPEDLCHLQIYIHIRLSSLMPV